MFDNAARSLKEKVFQPIALPLRRVPPMTLTWVALVMGILAAVMLLRRLYLWAFLFWILNRFFDGLDGTVARMEGSQSDLGGYLDILIDFVVYALVPVALVMGDPDPLRYRMLAVLLAVFYVNAASWMYLAAILEKRQHGARMQGEKTTVTMPSGLVGGVETILFYSAFILLPGQVVWLFGLMSLLTFLTVLQRLLWAYQNINEEHG